MAEGKAASFCLHHQLAFSLVLTTALGSHYQGAGVGQDTGLSQGRMSWSCPLTHLGPEGEGLDLMGKHSFLQSTWLYAGHTVAPNEVEIGLACSL